MTDNNMPVTEAENEVNEKFAYELAFHVLPTVAEGEVSEVVDTLKGYITKIGGEITAEEAAARFELAYEIEKYLEGKYRHFDTAYFGWVRFQATATVIAKLEESLKTDKNLLRYLIIRLSATEEANPFNFHAAIADRAPKNIDVDELISESGEEEAEIEAEIEDTEVDESVSTEDTEDKD